MIVLSELGQLEEQFDAVELDSKGLVAGLTEEGSGGRQFVGVWSVSLSES
jgi:hypothetical protein